MRAARFVKLLRYGWALPTTFLGLLFVPATLLGRVRLAIVGGNLELHGGIVTFFLTHVARRGVRAMTLGHVILGRSAADLAACRAHEHVHVRQAERWGPFFLAAYGASSLWALLRGRHPYHDNRFEQEACTQERLASSTAAGPESQGRPA